MKFKVRDGFVCHVEIPQRDADGRPKEPIVNTYPAGTEVEMDADTAEKHKHKLEGLDRAANRFLLPSGVEVVDIDAEQAAAESAAAAGLKPEKPPA